MCRSEGLRLAAPRRARCPGHPDTHGRRAIRPVRDRDLQAGVSRERPGEPPQLQGLPAVCAATAAAPSRARRARVRRSSSSTGTRGEAVITCAAIGPMLNAASFPRVTVARQTAPMLPGGGIAGETAMPLTPEERTAQARKAAAVRWDPAAALDLELERVDEHIAAIDAAVLQRLLQPLDLAGARADQLVPVAGEVPQLGDVLGRDVGPAQPLCVRPHSSSSASQTQSAAVLRPGTFLACAASHLITSKSPDSASA